jgi:hypothetical protein
MLAPLLTYVGALALVAIVGVDLLGQWPLGNRMSVLSGGRVQSDKLRQPSICLKKQRPTQTCSMPSVAARTCRFRAGRARPPPCQPARRIGWILNRLILLTGGNRLKSHRSVRPRRTEAGVAPPGALVSDIGGWGMGAEHRRLRGTLWPGATPKTLVSIQLFFRHLIIVLRCGPIDLVTPYLCPLKCRQNRIWRPASPMRT